MSLYGHNDTLRKAAGDWVRPGEVLATVGDSGGQARPALYFEMRKGRAPQNPHPWFQKKLARR
jgi:septal ring factor EnvC (AmiA/AmiB activator)